MPALIPIDDMITAIDHDLLGVAGLGVTYVVHGDPEQVALIETGTSLTASATLAGLDQLGIARPMVRHILCTHVHMDHAGGAGVLVAALPNATVYINSAAAAHLITPARLMESTRRAVGELLWSLQGTIVPLASERIAPAETLRLDLGHGIVIRAVPTPGHSADHISFFEEQSASLFAGDACGIAIPRYGIGLRPITPPPGFDLEAQIATYERLRALPIARLFVTHCGEVLHVSRSIREQHLKLLEVVDAVRDRLAHGDLNVSALAAQFLPSAAQPVAHIWAEMTIAGIVRYFQRKALVPPT